MEFNFEQVHNYYERLVFEEVARRSQLHTDFSADMLADVACVALNRMTPHYIRHSADLAFFTTEKERQSVRRNIDESVDFAFGYVQARHVMAARR